MAGFRMKPSIMRVSVSTSGIGEDDDDSEGHFLAFDVPLTSSHVVDNAPRSLFTRSQTKAVWTSCHRIPLRC